MGSQYADSEPEEELVKEGEVDEDNISRADIKPEEVDEPKKEGGEEGEENV